MTDLLTAGEAMVVLGTQRPGPIHLHQQLSVSVAGAESTVAIGVSRLGHTASWVGRVGADAFGGVVEECLRAEAVDVSGLVVDRAAPTGVFVKEERLAGRVQVHYHRTGSAGSHLCAADIDEARVARARLVHLTGITPALSSSARKASLELARLAVDHGVAISLDVNYRPKLWSAEEARPVLRDLARSATIVFGGPDELRLLAPEARDDTTPAAAIAALGATSVVVKLGARGATLHCGDSTFTAAALDVQAVDHVGAGDGFVAGCLSALLDGESPQTLLERGCITGAFSVAAAGDWEGLPRREELQLADRAVGFTGR